MTTAHNLISAFGRIQNQAIIRSANACDDLRQRITTTVVFAFANTVNFDD